MKVKVLRMLVTALSTATFCEVLAGSCLPSIQVEVQQTGPGYQTIATDPKVPDLPDFVTNWVKITTPWGVEPKVYTFGLNESIDTVAQAENIGSGTCNGDITGHYYLSEGSKEDPHSGTGAWRRLDSATIHCSNLDPGATHTETKHTNLWEWITTPGRYNIVYCMDHPQDDHNNGGDYREEHESNNCSTPAVFDVVPGVVNMPDTDLIVSSIGIKGKSFLYTSEMYGAFMTIRNTGAVLPATTTRSQYAIKGPSTNNQYTQIADDGSEASNFSHNRDQYEEMISLIQAPSVPGWYTLRGCADYLNLANETNETNNCTEIPFEVRQAYPDFVVSAMWLREGTSIKKNTRVHPYCTVQNIGNGAPPRSILIAYYINSGVFRDNDTVEASEIGPGQSKTENVQNDNIKLGDRGNRTYTCCVDYQGQVAESNEGNNCATIGFKVK